MTRENRLLSVIQMIGGDRAAKIYLESFGSTSKPSCSGEYLVSALSENELRLAMFFKGQWLDPHSHTVLDDQVIRWAAVPSSPVPEHAPVNFNIRKIPEKSIVDFIWFSWLMTPNSIEDIAHRAAMDTKQVESVLNAQEGFPGKPEWLWNRLIGMPHRHPVASSAPQTSSIALLHLLDDVESSL